MSTIQQEQHKRIMSTIQQKQHGAACQQCNKNNTRADVNNTTRTTQGQHVNNTTRTTRGQHVNSTTGTTRIIAFEKKTGRIMFGIFCFFSEIKPTPRENVLVFIYLFHIYFNYDVIIVKQFTNYCIQQTIDIN